MYIGNYIQDCHGKSSFQQEDSFHQQLDFNLKKKLVVCYTQSIALYSAETWTLWKVDWKHLESLEIRCWRRMKKICWTDHVRNEV